MYKKIKCRWKTSKECELESLGIETQDNNYTYKEIHINLDKIKYIDEYQGYCCINFSAIEEDTLITDIPYKKIESIYK